MPNELSPRIDQWYVHLDKGQSFYVTGIDENNKTVEVQHFDGDVEEFSLDQWRAMDIELAEEPENWTGALDIAERDDLGTEITDTTAHDWNEPHDEYHPETSERREFSVEEHETGFDVDEAELED